MEKTIAVPKGVFQWGRLIWVSPDDVMGEACRWASLGTCICECIWCLGQSGSFPITYVSVSESHVSLPVSAWVGTLLRASLGVSGPGSQRLVACQPLKSVTAGSPA